MPLQSEFGLDGNEKQGVGQSNRLPFSNQDLEEKGWTVVKYGRSFKWVTDTGVVFYSSKAVMEYLKQTSERETASESEFEPFSDGTTSSPEKSLNSSPEKRMIPLPFEAYSATKR